MPHLLAAFDKFRGTATATEMAGAAARAAREAGWTADELPLADGGEGTLDALSRAVKGARRHTAVRGPLGETVEAEWMFVSHGLQLPLPGRAPSGPAAVIEAASAVGRALLPYPSGDEPLQASTEGVGDLILGAIDAGARLVIVGAGGSATTDGGLGALQAIKSTARLCGARLVVACDVTTPFRLAAETFGPQKGATPAQVATLKARLDALAERYRDELGVDVDGLEGAGAAGGLAGGLAALGAHLVSGFGLIASFVDLDRRVAAADLLVTGEGRLDATSFSGKVVGGVLGAGGGAVPALCVAGRVAADVEQAWAKRRGRVETVDLVATVGDARAQRPADALFDLVADACKHWRAMGRR